MTALRVYGLDGPDLNNIIWFQKLTYLRVMLTKKNASEASKKILGIFATTKRFLAP